jgi:transcriptional regulator with XRE-family HTH domain
MTHTTSNPKIHEGRNVKRFREMLGIKQEFLAFELGERLEPANNLSAGTEGEKIDSDILEQVSAILKIPAEAQSEISTKIKAVNVIANTFNDNAFCRKFTITYIFHPIAEIDSEVA